MTASSSAALLASVFVVGYTPGPANLYALACALRDGRRAALRTWWGLFAGFSVALWSVALCCGLLGASLGAPLRGLRYVGAAYLLWLAWGVAARGGARPDAAAARGSFRSGFLVQLTNAKIILFDATMFGTFAAADGNRWSDYLLVGALLYLAGPGANLAWLLGGGLLRAGYLRHARAVDAALGLALAGCAAWMAL